MLTLGNQKSAVALQRMACLKTKLTLVGSAVQEQRLTQVCLFSVVTGPW